MQGRSRMAAFAGVACALLLGVAFEARAEEKVCVAKVKLNVRIAGLTRAGCDVEVKPAHAGCRFEKVTAHVSAEGEQTVMLKDVECRNADRDCSFVITIKEDGQVDNIVRRGFRLPAPDPDRPAATPAFECYINAPSKLARAEAERTRR